MIAGPVGRSILGPGKRSKKIEDLEMGKKENKAILCIINKCELIKFNRDCKLGSDSYLFFQQSSSEGLSLPTLPYPFLPFLIRSSNFLPRHTTNAIFALSRWFTVLGLLCSLWDLAKWVISSPLGILSLLACGPQSSAFSFYFIGRSSQPLVLLLTESGSLTKNAFENNPQISLDYTQTDTQMCTHTHTHAVLSSPTDI